MSIGIALGFNCEAANFAVKNNIRLKKSEGYLTCPFDNMFCCYFGIIKCINDNFEGFCDPKNLSLIKIDTLKPCRHWNTPLDELWIFNKKYNFLFNHESPGHANLYVDQKWNGGVNHFTDNNYLKFIERYQKRIENFRNYLNSGKFITFVINKFTNDVSLLDETLKRKYPELKYNIIRINVDDMKFYLKFMKISSSHISARSNFSDNNKLIIKYRESKIEGINLLRYYASDSNSILEIADNLKFFWTCILSLNENFGTEKFYYGTLKLEDIVLEDKNIIMNQEIQDKEYEMVIINCADKLKYLKYIKYASKYLVMFGEDWKSSGINFNVEYYNENNENNEKFYILSLIK